ncbi:hypothetical protein J6590_024603, partial [Homalodisca vitripennis]
VAPRRQVHDRGERLCSGAGTVACPCNRYQRLSGRKSHGCRHTASTSQLSNKRLHLLSERVLKSILQVANYSCIRRGHAPVLSVS